MKNIKFMLIVTLCILSIIQCHGTPTKDYSVDYDIDQLIESLKGSEEESVERNLRRWKYNRKTSDRNIDMNKYEALIRKMQAKSLGSPNSEVGEIVDSMKPRDSHNPEEMGTYLEGDILTLKSKGKIPKDFLWPNGVIHYLIEDDFDAHDRDIIMRAMTQFHEHTCIRFKPWTKGVKDFIVIMSRHTGCWSSVGRDGGAQIVNLQKENRRHYGCFRSIGVPIHEFMHVLGIIHEQNRNDRNDYVTIVWKNIKSDKKHNFNLLPKPMDLGLKYDYNSIMHYTEDAFSKNTKHTIQVKKKTEAKIGQNKGLSTLDIEKIKVLYKC